MAHLSDPDSHSRSGITTSSRRYQWMLTTTGDRTKRSPMLARSNSRGGITRRKNVARACITAWLRGHVSNLLNWSNVVINTVTVPFPPVRSVSLVHTLATDCTAAKEEPSRECSSALHLQHVTLPCRRCRVLLQLRLRGFSDVPTLDVPGCLGNVSRREETRNENVYDICWKL